MVGLPGEARRREQSLSQQVECVCFAFGLMLVNANKKQHF